MKKYIKMASFWLVAYVAIVFALIPAAGSKYVGRTSMVRLDPQLSKDYNCIFIEGHSAKTFTVPWFSRNTRVEYLRLRYTPNDERQEYGIMFIDPRTMAYEADNCCVATPTRLGSRLDSPKPLLDWMRSQPHSTQAATHTNDASEIFSAIHALKSFDLEHFSLPAGFPLHNFVVGHQDLANRGGPSLFNISLLILLLAPMISKIIDARKSAMALRLHVPRASKSGHQP